MLEGLDLFRSRGRALGRRRQGLYVENWLDHVLDNAILGSWQAISRSIWKYEKASGFERAYTDVRGRGGPPIPCIYFASGIGNCWNYDLRGDALLHL
jgi:hypothetical protein